MTIAEKADILDLLCRIFSCLEYEEGSELYTFKEVIALDKDQRDSLSKISAKLNKDLTKYFGKMPWDGR